MSLGLVIISFILADNIREATEKGARVMRHAGVIRGTDVVNDAAIVRRAAIMLHAVIVRHTAILRYAKVIVHSWAHRLAILLLALVISAVVAAVAPGRVGLVSAQPAPQAAITDTDIALVIDGSGSMAETDPRRLRVDAVRLFRALALPTDRIAIIQFGEKAEKLSDLSHPVDDGAFDRALARINSRGQFTDLSAALTAGVELLSSESRTPSRKVIILLTDGRMDVNPFNAAYQGPEYQAATSREEQARAANLESLRILRTGPLQDVARLGWPVFTVAFTEAADTELLGEIAGASGGEFFIATDTGELHRTLILILSRLHGRQTIPSNNAREVVIDPSVAEVTFIVSRDAGGTVAPSTAGTGPAGPGGTGVTKIVDPGGRTYTSETVERLDGIWSGSDLYDVLTVKDPAPGAWQVKGSRGAPMVVALTDLRLALEVQSGMSDAPRVTAYLTEKGDPLPGGSAALRGLTIYASPRTSDPSTEWIPLGDDGTSGDEIAGDGRFTAVLPSLPPGTYRLTATAIAPTFRRQEEASFTVTPPGKVPARPAVASGPESPKVAQRKKSDWLLWLLAGLSGMILARRLASYRPVLAGTLLDVDGGEDIRLSGVRQVLGGPAGAGTGRAARDGAGTGGVSSGVPGTGGVSSGAACLEARRGRGAPITVIRRLDHRQTVAVNGRPIDHEAPVSVGDELTVGTKRYIYQRIRS